MPMYTLDQTKSGESLKLNLRDTLVITLEERPSTGYLWEVADQLVSDSPLVATISGFTNITQDKQAIGAGGIRRLEFKAVNVGECTLRLECRRPWEALLGNYTPVGEFVLNVTVEHVIPKAKTPRKKALTASAPVEEKRHEALGF